MNNILSKPFFNVHCTYIGSLFTNARSCLSFGEKQGWSPSSSVDMDSEIIEERIIPDNHSLGPICSCLAPGRSCWTPPSSVLMDSEIWEKKNSSPET